MRRLLPLAFALALVAACRSEPRVSIVARDGRETTFQVEIADTPAKREMGLQYRRELATDRGMIFVFAREEPHSFWMKNTPIPLDMIFISADRKIVGIVENTAPFSLDARGVAADSKYVLEINGGLSRRYGFTAGDPVRFEGFVVEPRN
jgi:uncharacterized membrane protein (UPF0127 family)